MSKNIITHESNISVHELIREMYSVISIEEEVSLLERIQLSDKEAIDIFYKSNTCFLLYLDKGH